MRFNKRLGREKKRNFEPEKGQMVELLQYEAVNRKSEGPSRL